MTGVEILVAVAIVVGLVGVVVPMLPGSFLVLAAILAWAWNVGSATSWIVLVAAAGFVMLGAVVKYVVPGRRLQDSGIPGSTMVLGGALGIVGFFLIPVVGVLVGFILGIYLAELRRVGPGRAWPATRHALGAAGLSLMIELAACLCAAATWAVGVVLT